MEQTLTELKGEIHKSTALAGDSEYLLSKMKKTSLRK